MESSKLGEHIYQSLPSLSVFLIKFDRTSSADWRLLLKSLLLKNFPILIVSSLFYGTLWMSMPGYFRYRSEDSSEPATISLNFPSRKT
jgi:hypothetical protein